MLTLENLWTQHPYAVSGGMLVIVFIVFAGALFGYNRYAQRRIDETRKARQGGTTQERYERVTTGGAKASPSVSLTPAPTQPRNEAAKRAAKRRQQKESRRRNRKN